MSLFETRLTPQQEVDYLIGEIRDTRTAYDNATVDKWRMQYIGSIGLRLNALVRATRKLIEADRLSPPSVSANDTEHCHQLEERANGYLNSAARIVAMHELNEWPADIRRELDVQCSELIAAADTTLKQVQEIVTRHSQA